MQRRTKPEDPDWPPPDMRRFIESDAFGRLLLTLASRYAKRYVSMDFSDAVAHVFVQFDRLIKEKPDLLSADRFPRFSAFRAYVGQMIWRTGILAQRQQSKLKRLEEVAPDALPNSPELSPERAAELDEAVQGLPEPFKSIIERSVMGGEDLEEVVADLGEDPERGTELLKEALDRLAW
jgi:DNA-directed RNA polymerase specialized sigma24 family protein